jgi:hypothetical protein
MLCCLCIVYLLHLSYLPGLNELPIFFSIHNIGTIAFSTFGGLVQSDWMVYWIAILIIRFLEIHAVGLSRLEEVKITLSLVQYICLQLL